MKKLLALFLSVMVLTVLSLPTANAVTLEAGENITISKNVLDDAYIFAGNANINAEIFGDLYIAGGIIVVNGNVHEDLVVAGGKVTVMGDVTGDLRVAGGQVAIYGNVGDDIIVAGGQVDIGKSSVVGGSVLTGTALLTLDGEVKEDVRGGVGMFILNGVIGRDVVVTIEDTINISETAKIFGDLKYSALIETSVPPGTVNGEVIFNQFERDSILKNITYTVLIYKIISFFSALLLSLLIVLLLPKALIRSASIARENILKSFGIGLLSIIAALVGIILLMVTVIGIPFALIIFSLFLIVIYTSKFFVCAWFASHILNFKKKLSKRKLFGGIVFALIIYYVIGIIPFLGWLVNLILFIIGVGIIVLLSKEQYIFLQSKNKV